MSVFIPDEIVEEVRERADIVDLISEYVTLKKSGKNYKGLCPFHHEKTPSFTVSPEKQIFYCFGCGEGGNIFSFLMKKESMTFPEAVRYLAERYGVTIPAKNKKDGFIFSKKEEMFKINLESMRFFHYTLLKDKKGEKARQYLKNRNISIDLIKDFTLGYTPELWDALFLHLKKIGSNLSIAEELGLLIKKKDGTYYERFRDRIIFPIRNKTGKVIGFGGRALNDEPSIPKYINSPESLIYQKGKNFYGLDKAYNNIREKDSAIVVEGYTDLIALHNIGFLNAVATLGTAITKEQVSLLKKLTSNIITLFDGDEAGIKAAQRAMEVAIEEDVIPLMVLLPAGYDPDQLIRKGEVDKLKEKLDHPVDSLTFFIEKRLKGVSDDFPLEKEKAINEAIAMVQRLKTPLKRGIYISKIAQIANLNEEWLYQSIKEIDLNKKERTIKHFFKNKRFPTGEEQLLTLVIKEPSFIPRLAKEKILDDFEDPDLQKIGEVIINLYKEKGELATKDLLFSLFSEENKKILARLMVEEERFSFENINRSFIDCINYIREKKRKKEAKELSYLIKKAEQDKNPEVIEKLLIKKQQLIVSKKEI